MLLRILKGLDNGGGRTGPADDGGLCADHLESGLFEVGEVAFGAVLDEEALVAAVVGFAHGGLDADFGSDAGDEEVGDAIAIEDLGERGVVERAFAGFVDDNFGGKRGEFGDDLMAVLAADEDTAHRAGIADFQFAISSVAFGGWAIGEVGFVAFACVDDGTAGVAAGGEEFLKGGDDGAKEGDVVAEGFAEAAGFEEIALHVNDKEGGCDDGECVGEGLGVDCRHSQFAPMGMELPVVGRGVMGVAAPEAWASL
jgi:hypothetical protein